MSITLKGGPGSGGLPVAQAEATSRIIQTRRFTEVLPAMLRHSSGDDRRHDSPDLHQGHPRDTAYRIAGSLDHERR
jgi:hypothetical protein